jgi:deoxyribose-phosphate aldolase
MDDMSLFSNYPQSDQPNLFLSEEWRSFGLSKQREQLAGTIEHTFLEKLLHDDETEQRITALCAQAIHYGFYGVCVLPQWVALAASLLEGSSVKVVTVIGFPEKKVVLASELESPTIGDIPTAIKLGEIKEAVFDGADELDIVMNVRQFKRALARWFEPTQVLEELYLLTMVSQGRPIKLIVETDLLTAYEIEQATFLCAQSGLAFIKTSTGMVQGGQGGTPAVVAQIYHILHNTLDMFQMPKPAIKASGGIRTLAHAQKLLEMGVQRIGTSQGIAILRELENGLL